MRMINYTFTPDQFVAVMEATGREETTRALGYLTTWGLNAYDYVEVSASVGPMGTEFAAAFYPTAPDPTGESPRGQLRYLLMAIWDVAAGRFGFHS